MVILIIIILVLLAAGIVVVVRTGERQIELDNKDRDLSDLMPPQQEDSSRVTTNNDL